MINCAKPFYSRNCFKYVRSNLVPSRQLPNSCLLNPGRGPKSNRTSRLFPVALSKGKATQFVRTRGFIRGRILYTPTPPPLKNPSKGGGRTKEGGGIKFLPRGLQNTQHPPLSPLKMPSGQNRGEGGGGGYVISPRSLVNSLVSGTPKI